MNVLGITPLQQYIVKQVQLGNSYESIADELHETVYEVVHQEMLAYSVLSKRWKKKEIEVRKVLSGMLLLLLSFVGIFESQVLDDLTIERAMRAKPTRVSKARRREIEDLATIDV